MDSIQEVNGDQGPLVNILVWVFTSLATIFVILRLVSRLKLKPSAGLDDIAIVIALVVDIAYSIVISIAVSKGTGRRAATLTTPGAALAAGKWNVIAIETGIFSFGLPKTAIALLLGRILNIRRALCWVLYAMAGTLIVYAVIQDVVFIEQCDPVEGAWNRTIKATCWNPWPITVSGIVYSSLSAFLDLFYAILPIAVISKLNMNNRKKLSLAIMMGLGVVAGIIAIYKTTRLPALASPKADFTWATAPLLYWSSIEANCVIVAACVPTINPVIQLMTGKSSPETVPSGKYQYSNGPQFTEDSAYGGSGESRTIGDRMSDGAPRRVQLKRDKNGWYELRDVENAMTPEERQHEL